MAPKITAFFLFMVLGPAAAHAENHLGNAIITAPDRWLPPTCYRIDNDILSAALFLEEIEGEAIDVRGYGNVTTAEGDGWGFLISFTGVLDGAFLTGTGSTLVEGALVEEPVQWAFVDGGLVTDMGTFASSDCDGIDEEFINRSIN